MLIPTGAKSNISRVLKSGIIFCSATIPLTTKFVDVPINVAVPPSIAA